MNLGEFHTEVKSSLARGTALDTAIPGFVRRAVLFLERTYEFAYMRQFFTVNIDLDVASTPRFIELSPGAPKAIRLVRWVLEDGEYQNLRRIDPSDMDSLEEGTPNGFWLDGVRRLVLNKTPDENLSGEIQMDRYTPWPAELEFTHWLIDRAEDVLLAQTLIFAAIRLRDPKMRETYTQARDEGLTTLIRAEDELLFGNQTAEMEYLPAR